jgi:cellulose synthase/poly-beta-1,6-N-acetylglucosamine synthase-like glycosyltransferase
LKSAARYATRVAACAIPLVTMPATVFQICGAVLALWFLAFTCLRLAGSMTAPQIFPYRPPLADKDLPVYTIISALYREAESIAPLLRAIEALDYPPEKLDIIFAVEPDDLQTRAAIARLKPKPNLRVVVTPDGGPRTKPKALNYSLQFARGHFVTIFDAEDRPDSGQLRTAIETFRAHDGNVACVQASLCIDNTADGWLTRMFTAEYAGQFDAFLQGFSKFEMPLPLGGSSNHFSGIR